MLRILDSVVSDDVPAEGVTSKNEPCEVAEALPPVLHHDVEEVDGLLGSLVEVVHVWSAAATHAQDVDQDKAVVFREAWYQPVKERSR